MQPRVDIRALLSLFLRVLPHAFNLFLTTNVLFVFTCAADSINPNYHGAPTSSTGVETVSEYWGKKKRRTSENLTDCAKSCRAEFLDYCHTREGQARGNSAHAQHRSLPDPTVDLENSNNDRRKTNDKSSDTVHAKYTAWFRKCMCVYPSGVVYMDYCARNCKGNSAQDINASDQIGELRKWWDGWCASHPAITDSTPSPSSASDFPATGLSFVDYHTKHSTSTPSPRPEWNNTETGYSSRQQHGSSGLYVAGTATFASAFLIFGYFTLMRRSKYARRKGILAWLRFKFLEYRGYHHAGTPGLNRSHSTAMRLGVINGRTAVVGNPKWLNKSMPPLPAQHHRNRSFGEFSFRSVGHDKTEPPRQLFPLPIRLFRRVFGRSGSELGMYSRSPALNNNRRGSYRYSLGWITAAQRYTDATEEEDRTVQGYFQSKGIIRPAKYTGLDTDDADCGGNEESTQTEIETELVAFTKADQVEVGRGKDTLLEPSGGDHDEDEPRVEWVQESGSAIDPGDGILVDSESVYTAPVQSPATIRDYGDYDFPTDTLASATRTGSVSSEGEYFSIAETPSLVGSQWDSWTGIEGCRIDATGGLNRVSGYDRGGSFFEEVDLVGSSGSYDGHGWSMGEGSSPMGYGPILPVIEPDAQHRKTSPERHREKQTTSKSKWRIGARNPKDFLKPKGKRPRGNGDTGRGSYETL